MVLPAASPAFTSTPTSASARFTSAPACCCPSARGVPGCGASPAPGDHGWRDAWRAAAVRSTSRSTHARSASSSSAGCRGGDLGDRAGALGARPARAPRPAPAARPGAGARVRALGRRGRRHPHPGRARRAGDRRGGGLRRGAGGPGERGDGTRPVMQGSRLTAWECVRDGIPHRLIADVVAASVMARGEVDLVVTGADRIAANGDTANKIGTYALAVLARHHGVPFYVAAPFSTIDPALPSGAQIPIEERDALEVRRVGGQLTAPEESPVYNPAFDVTPAALIAAIVTDRGVYRPPYRF